jgi:hypothetical protein
MFGSCCSVFISPNKNGAEENHTKEADAEASICPAVPMEMLRSKIENRILKPSFSSGNLSDKDTPLSSARSLFEASMRRVEQNQRSSPGANRPDSEDQGIPLRFLEAYVTALKDGNTKFASSPAISDMFADSAKLIAQDKQTYHGKAAVLRRLDKGMETLVKMAGKDAAIPTYELEGPTQNDEGAHVIKCTLRRGVTKMGFALEFLIIGGKVMSLTNSRT